MYNLFQYVNTYRQRLNNNHQQKLQVQFQLRHQQFKNNSHAKLQSRAQDFLMAQKKSSYDNFYFGNSNLKIQNNSSLINTTRSKVLQFDRTSDNYMPINKRNIKNKSHSSNNNSRKNMDNSDLLIQNKQKSPQIILKRSNPQELINISIKAYDKNKSNQFQRPNTQFDHNYNNLCKSFQNSKQKLLNARKGTLKKYENRLYNQIRKYKKVDNSSKQQNLSKFSMNPQQYSQLIETAYSKDKQKQKRQNKIYFKLAKTMQMFHPNTLMRDQFEDILKRSNYSVDKRTKKYYSNMNNK